MSNRPGTESNPSPQSVKILDRLAALVSQKAQHRSADTSSKPKEEESRVCFHNLTPSRDFIKVVPRATRSRFGVHAAAVQQLTRDHVVLVIDGGTAVDTYDLRHICLEIILSKVDIEFLCGKLTMPPASRRRAVKPSSPDMIIFGMAVSRMEANPTAVMRTAKAPAKAP